MNVSIGLSGPEWRVLLQPDATSQIFKYLYAGFEMLGETPLPDDMLMQHAADLVGFGYLPSQVVYAIRKLRHAPVPGHMRRRAPLSGDIHNLLSPEATVDDRADKLMQTVMGCIPRFGYMQGEAAKARMGETAWSVVERQGGWRELCGYTCDDNVTTVRAQIKKSMAQALRAEDETLERARLAAHDASWQLELAGSRHDARGPERVHAIVEGLCRKTQTRSPSLSASRSGYATS